VYKGRGRKGYSEIKCYRTQEKKIKEYYSHETARGNEDDKDDKRAWEKRKNS